MNAGIQDGMNLAWRLAAHLRLSADPAILDGYDTDRQEMFEKISRMSDATHRMMVARDPTTFARPELQTPEAMALADRNVGEVALAYSRDRMWRDEAESGLIRPGMRVPPSADFATGDGASRPWASLYDGVNWTLILAVPDRSAVRTQYIRLLDLPALVWLNGRVRLVLAAGDAFAWNAPRPTIYMVRPDGYVSFRCDAPPGDLPDVGSLTNWLIQNFGPSFAQP